MAQAYLEEARWFHRNHIPTTEEYLNIATMKTGGHKLLTTSSFIYMGDIVTEDIFKWAMAEPKIIEAASVIVRFMNDIVSREVCI